MTQVKVSIPKAHFNAVSYTFKCLFNEFLGIDIEVSSSESQENFLLEFGTKSLEIENIFFRTKDPDNLYRKENIPAFVDKGEIKIADKNLPVLSLYGKSSITIQSENFIRLHADIVGSTFFMLSRWEEAVVKDRDVHGRFDYRSAASVKLGFYQRPIVNEYVELLWELCRFFQPELKRVKRQYELTVTSDIDELRKWKSPKKLLESIYLHITRGKSSRIFRDIANYLGSVNQPKNDFYNNLNYLVQNTKGIDTIFYLKTRSSHPKHDKNTYKLKDYASELQNAISQDIKIGIHPKYDSYLNCQSLKDDVESLQSFLGSPVKLVRQHYLRFSVPETWRFQVEANLKEDSTMIFPHKAGFRNGVCYRFPVFDFKADQQLDIYESPLLLMETSYLNSGFDELLNDAKSIVQSVKQYNGNFVLLWHNGNLVYREDRHYFEKLLNIASDS